MAHLFLFSSCVKTTSNAAASKNGKWQPYSTCACRSPSLIVPDVSVGPQSS
ncbi:Uncharacterized protein APZ42_021896 [Daphnia magna]|uniref:Uncharacterized protein n=1 Tax=Daphnia magna TaxID=35525 RepID=A0A164W906_9CRUS|nr:Uncharacterized protein APZ42_021896 [Daphnia magna]